jgi:hypothetical protein
MLAVGIGREKSGSLVLQLVILSGLVAVVAVGVGSIRPMRFIVGAVGE